MSERRHWSWVGLWMMVIGVAGFVAVAADVVWHGRLWQWDQPIHEAIYRWADAASWRPIMHLPVGVLCFAAVSALGDFRVAAFVGVTAFSMLMFRKRHWSAIVWATALVGSAIINPALKSYFQTPRPAEHSFYQFPPNSGYSFPSGHTMAVTVVAGALAMVLLREIQMKRSARRWLVIGVVVLSLLEAFALMYVGVHYLTDVLGGLFASLAWLGVVRWMLGASEANRAKSDQVTA